MANTVFVIGSNTSHVGTCADGKGESEAVLRTTHAWLLLRVALTLNPSARVMQVLHEVSNVIPKIFMRYGCPIQFVRETLHHRSQTNQHRVTNGAKKHRIRQASSRAFRERPRHYRGTGVAQCADNQT